MFISRNYIVCQIFFEASVSYERNERKDQFLFLLQRTERTKWWEGNKERTNERANGNSELVEMGRAHKTYEWREGCVARHRSAAKGGKKEHPRRSPTTGRSYTLRLAVKWEVVGHPVPVVGRLVRGSSRMNAFPHSFFHLFWSSRRAPLFLPSNFFAKTAPDLLAQPLLHPKKPSKIQPGP